MDVLFLKPFIKETIWGGTRLAEYQCKLPSDHVGECWAISGHPDGNSTVVNGEFKGKTIEWLWNQHRELFHNYPGEVFPLLTKIIDAKNDLSIQVHPDNEYAKLHENGALGKTECWYVLDAKPDATIVIGHHAKTRTEMKDMIEQKRWHDFIREIPVKKGDFFQINPGTLHAIKGGTVILETQQNSDITYRVYDYDRLSNGVPRELHLQKSMDVINVPYCSEEISHLPAKKTNNTEFQHFVTCPYYTVWKCQVTSSMTILQDQDFMLVSIIDGEGFVNDVPVSKGTHFIIPYGIQKVFINGNMQMIVSAV